MKHKKSIKKFLKSFFILIQAIVFMYSISLKIIAFTVYLKARDILQMSLGVFLLLFGISSTSALSSILGFHILNTKKKLKLTFWILITMFLINFQVILAIKSSLLPEKSLFWGDNIWEGMNEYQKNFVQERFKCCGFRDTSDRNATVCNFKDKSCFKVLYNLSLSLRMFIERSVVFMLFIESMGVCIVSLIKYRR